MSALLLLLRYMVGPTANLISMSFNPIERLSEKAKHNFKSFLMFRVL